MRMGVGCGSTDQPGESGQSESDVRAAKRAEILSDSGESDKCLSNVADSSGLDRILSHNPIDSLHFKIPKAEAVDFVSTPEDCLDSATFEESKVSQCSNYILISRPLFITTTVFQDGFYSYQNSRSYLRSA